MVDVMEITMTYRCNCNCRFCSVGLMRKKLFLSTDDIKKKIVEANEKNIPNLGFGGGEPTIRKDLIEILEFAKKFEFRVIRIQTNGQMLSYENYVDKILDAGANFFIISIHGHTAKLHDYLTRVKGSFEKCIKAIANLKKRDISIQINIVINKHNYKVLPQITNFFMKKGISKFCFVYPTYEGNAKENFEEIGVKMTEVAPYLRESLDMLDEKGMDKNICLNITQCVLNPEGKNIYSIVKKFDTVVSTPSGTDNIDDANKEHFVKIDACKKCVYNLECMGLWKNYVNLFGTDEIKPVLERLDTPEEAILEE
ncbi:MAG: 7,8-dihydro-6-hydroxymethylpterin dimethyltransferase [Candidatus Woesearchaeota archaeon]|nr:7,8-dihydro-6-hydroxymethylpterin dimethyltransferase [Candidatus Woesearchaeota archaeon]